MTASICVCYGTPADPSAFDAYYRDVHIPLARTIPGLTGVSWDKCAPMGRTAPPYYSIATLRFADAQARSAALASPEMGAAGADVRNFADGGVTMFLLDAEPIE